jgi:hypothetical protein
MRCFMCLVMAAAAFVTVAPRARAQSFYRPRPTGEVARAQVDSLFMDIDVAVAPRDSAVAIALAYADSVRGLTSGSGDLRERFSALIERRNGRIREMLLSDSDRAIFDRNAKAMRESRERRAPA